MDHHAPNSTAGNLGGDEALRRSEARYRALVEATSQSVWSWSPDGTAGDFAQARRWWEELTGQSEDAQAAPASWLDAVHPDDREAAGRAWQAAIDAGESYDVEYRVRSRRGGYRHLHARGVPVRGRDGSVLEWVGTLDDVTEQREAEAEARRSETRFRRLASAGIVGVIRWNLDTSLILDANDEFLRMTGYDRADLAAGRLDFRAMTPPEWTARNEAGIHALRGTGVGGAYEKEYFRKDGSRVPVIIVGVRFEDSAGEGMSFVMDITERKRAEEQLRESEGRFARFMQHLPGLAWIKDARGRYVYANDAALRAFRRRREELYGRGDEEIFPPETVAQFAENDRRALAAGVAVQVVETLDHADGEIHHSIVSKFPIPGPAGGPPLVGGMAIDITERLRAEQTLREGEERLRLALEAGRMAVWEWNLGTDEFEWSDNFEAVHGLPPGSFGGTFEAFQALIHPDDREPVRRVMTQAREEACGYDIEFRIVRADGCVHWMSGQGKGFWEGGRPARMIGVRMDITDRKRAEQDARFLADASSSLAGLVDYESTLRKVARLAVPHFADWATVDMLDGPDALRRVAVAHVDPTKVELAHELHRRFPPDPAVPQGIWKILRTGKSEMVPEISDDLLAATVKDEALLGILRALGLRSYMGVPLSARGKVLGAITFIAAESGRRYDAADLALAEDLAHRAAVAIENAKLYQEIREADRKKDEFLATLAHELRNPLAPIRNSLQILEMPGVDAKTIERSRQMIGRQVHHLVRLVDDLLDVSRVMRGKIELRRERVDLAAVVARAVETAQPLIDAQRHALSVNVPAESLPLDADPVRLAQVVGNLLTNAAKYTEPNGHIWLSARREGGEAVLRVRDDGIGIAPDVLPHVFDLFVQVDHAATRSQGGLGIGLTLVKNLVGMHLGTVEARSAGLGKGCEFVVRLPLATTDPQGRGEEGGQQRQAAPARGRRLLVVDDNRDAANSLAVLLRLQGHEVRVAHDGPSALGLAPSYRPDAVFLDLGMPGMDGCEVARRLRRTPGLEGTVLAALTGWGQTEDRRRTAEAGFDHHLVKPVEPKAVESLLAELKRPDVP